VKLLYSQCLRTSPLRSRLPRTVISDAQMKGFVSKALTLMTMVGSTSVPWKLSMATGVRTTVGAIVPLVIWQLAGNAAAGMIVGIGGLIVSLSDIGGPYRTKAVVMGVATISGAAATFLGTIVGGSLWLSLPLVFLCACAAGLAGVYGNASAKVSLLSLILFVLMVGVPAGVTQGAERCVAFIGGGLWAMMLSLWLWPLHPYQPVQEAVAACYRTIGASPVWPVGPVWAKRTWHQAGSHR
jgi:FUSC-like inner membrane protein yccS